MVLGNIVKLVVGLQGLVNIIIGLMLLISPVIILQNFPDAQVDGGSLSVIGILIMIWGAILLKGAYNLHEAE